MTSPRKIPALCFIAILGTLAPFAFAHANLDHADPKVGSELDAAPKEIKIWFTQEIEPALSFVKVFDSAGKQIDLKDFHLDPADKKIAILTLPPLPPGKYKVTWQAIASDTHKTQGDFTFTIKPNPKSPQTKAANP